MMRRFFYMSGKGPGQLDRGFLIFYVTFSILSDDGYQRITFSCYDSTYDFQAAIGAYHF